MTPRRIVFLGSSSTDGFTYPLLLRQALAESGRPLPELVNAGAGGNTMAEMRTRLARDVLRFAPDLVVIYGGMNDALRKVPSEVFAAELDGTVLALQAHGAEVLLLTPTPVGSDDAAVPDGLDACAQAVRRVGRARGCRVVDVHQRLGAALDAGEPVRETDRVHPTYAGHRLIARMLLDALGQRVVPLPAEFAPAQHPGVVTPWRVRGLPSGKKPPAAAEILALWPGADWPTLVLPEREPQAHWWQEQLRREGFALSLARLCGPAPRFVACAVLESATARAAFLNTGGQLERVWLNGECLPRDTGWFGYHAGRDRIPVRLVAGANQLVVETAGPFFLSVTDTLVW